MGEGRLATSKLVDPRGLNLGGNQRTQKGGQAVQVEEVVDVQLGSLNHWKGTLESVGNYGGWEVFTIEDDHGTTVERMGVGDSREEQPPFIPEAVQSTWVMEFLWGV